MAAIESSFFCSSTWISSFATAADFDAWVAKTRQSADKLDAATYGKLAERSRRHPITYYSAVEPKLFDKIIAKYVHDHQAMGK